MKRVRPGPPIHVSRILLVRLRQIGDVIFTTPAVHALRRGRGFDDVGEVCVGKPPPQRVHRRGGEDDVAILAESDEQDPRDVKWGAG